MPILAAFVMGPVAAKPPAPEAGAPPESEMRFSENKTYDLGSLIDLGLVTHPGTRAAWFQARAASAAIGEAKAPYFPRISARFEGGSDQWYTPAANGPDNFRREQATTILSLEYLLLDFGRRAADVRRSVALFDSLGLLYERKLQQVVFDVQRCYFAHEAALWRSEAAAAMLEVTRVLAKTVKKENETGLSATPDLLAARKKVLEAEFEAESANALVRTTLGDLCVAAGLPANAHLRVTKSEIPSSTRELREQAGKLIEKALASRPDLAARAADVRASEAATSRASADFMPEVRLEGKYAYSAFGYDARDGRTKGSYSEDITGYGGFLVASWDVFDGFERIQKKRRRQEEEKAAREDLGQARLNATRDVWTAYQETLSAARRVDYAEGFVVSAKENFAAMSSGYDNGLATVSEFSEAAGELALAQSTRAGALADYSISLAAVAFAAGEEIPETSKPAKDAPVRR
ncbi:MAG: TolC family protein [Terrimicrobiaceae bacterium]